MRRLRMLVVLLSGVAALLWQLPASWADWGLARHSRGSLRLAGAEGSVWQGRAELWRLDEQGGAQPLTTVCWRWQPASLRQGRLQWRVEQGGQVGRLEWRDGWDMDTTEVR